MMFCSTNTPLGVRGQGKNPLAFALKPCDFCPHHKPLSVFIWAKHHTHVFLVTQSPRVVCMEMHRSPENVTDRQGHSYSPFNCFGGGLKMSKWIYKHRNNTVHGKSLSEPSRMAVWWPWRRWLRCLWWWDECSRCLWWRDRCSRWWNGGACFIGIYWY